MDPSSLKIVGAVAFGSAVGGVARYGITSVIADRAGTGFPIGTLVVNVAGCLLIGILARVFLESAHFSIPARALLATGFCGGFTTFSAFSWEVVGAMKEGAPSRAALYVVASLAAGLCATWIGYAAGGTVLSIWPRPGN